jgi:hypothetical protein
MKRLIISIDIIRELVGNDNLYFDHPIVIERPGLSVPINIWAVSVSPASEVFLMDAFEAWHKLEETDLSFQSIATKLEQRLGSIINNMNKKIAS